MKSMMIVYFFAFCFLFSSSCEQGPGNDPDSKPVEDSLALPMHKDDFKYTLDRPDDTAILSRRLEEISGLGLSSGGDMLIANNDENGRVFFLRKSDGKLLKSMDLGGGGDYEGIEAVPPFIYLVESKGDLHRKKESAGEEGKDEKLETELDGGNDVEGLAYDPGKNRLLLACKGKAGKGKKYKDTRGIYAFDLATETLSEEPVYLIDRELIRQYFRKEGISHRLIEIFFPEQASDAFAPSGIAVHPLTGEIYLISSVGKLLIVLAADGTVLYMEKLDAGLLPQPEGICFDKDGTLFISSEGRGGGGKLLRFSLRE